MNKYLFNERGFTLVEMLAVIIIASFIMIFSTSLIVQAMKNQERITSESQLRDEADVWMAQLHKAIFTLKESAISKVECGTVDGSTVTVVSCATEAISNSPEVQAAKQAMESCALKSSCTQYALIYLKDGKKIGFEGEKLLLKDETIAITNKNIKLAPYYTMEKKERSYTKSGKTGSAVSIVISFQLSNTTKNMEKSFQNEVITVDDI